MHIIIFTEKVIFMVTTDNFMWLISTSDRIDEKPAVK